MIKKGWIRKRGHLYFLAGNMFSGSHAGSAFHITLPPQASQPSQANIQRPHAIRAAAKLFKTHADRARTTLLASEFAPRITLGGSCLELSWQAKDIKLFRNGRIELRPSLPEYPLNVPLDAIKRQAAKEAGSMLEAFLAETGLKAMRDREGRLAIEITYWENGYPNNEIAQETMAGQKIVYAYDKETGKEAIWGDMSLNPFVELETNSEVADKEIKLMMQAINDKEIQPYADEIRTRREISDIIKCQQVLQQQQEATARQQASNSEVLAGYAHQIKKHLKIMKAIDRRLEQASQRHLQEWQGEGKDAKG